jgi:hypothetical protein
MDGSQIECCIANPIACAGVVPLSVSVHGPKPRVELGSYEHHREYYH